MKKRYFVFGFLAVFFLTVSAAFLFLIPQESRESEELPAEKVEKEMAYTDKDEAFAQFEAAYESYTGEMEQFLNAFMDLTYNCNYEERHYYDGAGDFMTEECYGYYIPMEDPKAVEDTFPPYASYLHDTDYYYRSITESRAGCLARIRYSSSYNQSDIQEQEDILLLSLIRVQGEWKIESIETLEV